MRRICKNCGAEFDTKSKHVILCPDCHDKAKHTPTIIEKTCRECGKVFAGGPRSWYCPECRKERRKATNLAHKKRGASRKIGSTDICERCGNTYIVNSGRQRYCSNCAKVAVYESIRDDKIKYQVDYRKKHPDRRKPQIVNKIKTEESNGYKK